VLWLSSRVPVRSIYSLDLSRKAVLTYNTVPYMETPKLLASINLAFLRYLMAATVVMLMTISLHANVVNPGDSNIVPDVFPNVGNPPLLGLTSGTFSLGSGTGLLTGSYFDAVLVDPLGVTCAGCLDFAFQVNLDSGLTAGINLFITTLFSGFTTDVGYIDGTGVQGSSGGNGNPLLITRGPFGGGVVFLYSNLTNLIPIGPGGSSAILVVATNAKFYNNLGQLEIRGGSVGNPTDGFITGLFEPVAVPEPSAALLLSLGLVGLAVFRKRTS